MKTRIAASTVIGTMLIRSRPKMRNDSRKHALKKLAHWVRPPPMMFAVLLTMPGMIVKPPPKLEHTLQAPIDEQRAVGVGPAAIGVELVHGGDRGQGLGPVDQQQDENDVRQRQPEVGIAEHLAEMGQDDAVLQRSFGHVDQVLRVQVQEEQAGQRAEDEDPHRGRHDLEESPRDRGQDKQDRQADHPQAQDLDVHRREVMGGFAEDGPELMGLELHAHEQRDLLGDDQQADRRQHALDGGGREHGAEAGHLQLGQDHLHAPAMQMATSTSG